jgi:DNA polymerase-3 subunit gamma/tau
MAEQAGRFGQAELTRAAEIISEGLIQMRGTTSPRLLLELTCAQVLLPAASTGEKALLARLERLEHQLAGVESGPPETVGRAGGRPGGQAGGPGVPAGRSGPGRDRGKDQSGPGPDRDGADLHGDADPPADAARREGSGSRSDGSSPGDASPPDEASPPGEAGPPGEASPRRDAPDLRRGAGPVDAETLRQRWPEILDAVRGKSKVAWILLNTATVQELEAGVLTIAFPSEGNARGFASSGHDQVLTGALTALLGLNVRVRAVSAGPQPASSPAGSTPSAGRPVPGPAARTRPAPGPVQDDPSPAAGAAASGAPSGDPPATPPAGPRPEGRTRGPAAAANDGRPARPAKDPAAKDPAARDPAAKGPAAKGPAASGQPARAARSRPAPPGPQAAAFAEEEWPDDAGPAGTGAEDLTGMELIRRQLGGRVIQEIEDS